VKKISLSADEQLTKRARLLAKSQHKTLNALFREWLSQLTAQTADSLEFEALVNHLKHVQPGQRFSRNATNQR
jgi:hypothetical protein